MNSKKLLLTLLLSAILPSICWAQAVERVEPPSWWVGMKSPTLQLLVHGEQIAALSPKLTRNYPGVSLQGFTRLGNPNYLVLDLLITAKARAGSLPLQFSAPGKPTLKLDYLLQARTPGAALAQGFGPKDAIYLLVPDRFAKAVPQAKDSSLDGEDRANSNARHGGNIEGLRQHLDYIADLGFTQLWPTPLVENKGAHSYHGYAATDFYRIDPRFGSNSDYQQLVREAKARGIGMIQDIVLNHIGDKHWWMADLPANDWLNQGPAYSETHHARATLQDPHAAPSDRKRFSEGWFVPGMPDLNQRNPVLANYLTQMSIWWVEYAGLSGIRADTYSYSDKAFLATWSQRLMQEYPRLNIVGEEWSPHPAFVAYWQRGRQNHDGYVSHMPSMMDFPLHGALLAGLGESDGHDSGLTKLYEALAHDFLYPAPNNLVLFEGNHDTPRLFTALKQDPALYKMALVYLASVNRIPQFYYGDELMLQSPLQRDDGAVRPDFPGGWAGDTVNAFTGDGLSEPQREAQAFTRKLFNWRKTAEVVHSGRLMQYAPENGCYVFFRYGEKQRLMVVLNKSAQPVRLDTRRFAEMLTPQSSGIEVLTGTHQALGRELSVPARSALLLELAPEAVALPK
ncbi:glycoside hydrolase family 13 protein [Paucibacter oligotrophus]|uniref:Glycoside hydrolase family 13 protein n=2 Tax=Roseateles oligotrophus TaxID=1769250 RepID=A0ABT2YLI3_9BURK|nr:glycoside hydrolase family 13 protein [Roseateles oligotrophus]